MNTPPSKEDGYAYSLTFNKGLTKIVPSQTLDHQPRPPLPPLHPKVLVYVEILRIWLGRVAHDFKLNFEI